MPALLLHPLVLFAFSNLKRDMAALWRWLCHRSFWQLVSMGLAIFAIVQHFQIIGARHEAAKWHHQFDGEHGGRIADRTAYIKAQAEARALNQTQVATIERKHQEINNERVTDLNSRLELIRRELRRQSASTAPHDLGSPSTGSAVASPCRAIDPAWLCLAPADRLRAAENEERHDQLIDWNLKQSKIDPNK